ncbi:MAG: hypothetical protein M0C28_18855 [Candidatus Moduliflexus flocculans]|nr:hypothetical protein [Candidatus Moduliflexus flocculans]
MNWVASLLIALVVLDPGRLPAHRAAHRLRRHAPPPLVASGDPRFRG